MGRRGILWLPLGALYKVKILSNLMLDYPEIISLREQNDKFFFNNSVNKNASFLRTPTTVWSRVSLSNHIHWEMTLCWAWFQAYCVCAWYMQTFLAEIFVKIYSLQDPQNMIIHVFFKRLHARKKCFHFMWGLLSRGICQLKAFFIYSLSSEIALLSAFLCFRKITTVLIV